MDLALYAHVLGKHKRFVFVGAALAIVLATFSYYRVEMGVVPKLTPRKAEVWQSSASVLLTQRSQVVPVPGRSDPARLASVAAIYARLAMSDEVLQRVPKASRVVGGFQAGPGVDPSSESVLPIISFLGTGSSPGEAKAIVGTGLQAFLGYVRAQQKFARIPERSEVQLRVLNGPQPAVLVEPRKKTLPIVVFLSVMFAAIASIFVLENRMRLSSTAESERAPGLDEGLDVIPLPHDVELRPASTVEAEWGQASNAGVDLGPKSEDKSEPEPAPTRRWA